jgi:hypothetical protein
VVGIAAAAGLWLGRLAIGRTRYLDWNFRVQCWWARTLFTGARHIFGMHLDVKGLDQLATGAILLFMRHASVGDTVLPAVLVSSHQGIRLRNVLPPRLGGTMALLEVETNADAVFCVHTGFEGVRTFHDLFGGGLVDRTIEVEYWRVPAAHIPRDADARIDWLYDQWTRVDEWVGHRSEAILTASAPSQNQSYLG